jgi:hypothetical protein
MGNESAVRAGQAYVELYADNSKLVANLNGAKQNVAAFGTQVNAIDGSTKGAFRSLGSTLSKLGKAGSRILPADFASGAGDMKTMGMLMKLQALLSGPMGWGALAIGAAMAGFELLKTRKEIDYTSESIKKLNEGMAKLTGEEFVGRKATVLPSGDLEVWKEATTAASQHEKAMGELADADHKKQIANASLAEQQANYNKLLEKQEELDSEAEKAQNRLGSGGSGHAPSAPKNTAEVMKASDNRRILKQNAVYLEEARLLAAQADVAWARAAEEERRSAAETDKLAAAELMKLLHEEVAVGLVKEEVKAYQHRTDKANAYVKSLEDEAFAIGATAEALVRKKAAELDMTEAETATAVAAVRKREAAKLEESRLALVGHYDIFDNPDQVFKLQDEARDRAMKQAKDIADFTVQQNDEAARLEIEMSGKTKEEKAKALLDLKHQQEQADLWAKGLGGTNAEDALLARQDLESKQLSMQQQAFKQTTSGTFNATMVGRMGSGNYAERTARATEKTAKGIDQLLRRPQVARQDFT